MLAYNLAVHKRCQEKLRQEILETVEKHVSNTAWKLFTARNIQFFKVFIDIFTDCIGCLSHSLKTSVAFAQLNCCLSRWQLELFYFRLGSQCGTNLLSIHANWAYSAGLDFVDKSWSLKKNIVVVMERKEAGECSVGSRGCTTFVTCSPQGFFTWYLSLTSGYLSKFIFKESGFSETTAVSAKRQSKRQLYRYFEDITDSAFT